MNPEDSMISAINQSPTGKCCVNIWALHITLVNTFFQCLHWFHECFISQETSRISYVCITAMEPKNNCYPSPTVDPYDTLVILVSKMSRKFWIGSPHSWFSGKWPLLRLQDFTKSFHLSDSYGRPFPIFLKCSL